MFGEPLLGIIYINEIFGFKTFRKCLIQSVVLILSTTYLSKIFLKLFLIDYYSFFLPSQVAQGLQGFIQQASFWKIFILINLVVIVGTFIGIIIQMTRHYSKKYFQKASIKIHVILPLIMGLFIVFMAHFGSVRVLGSGGHLLTDILATHQVNSSADFAGKYINCLLSILIGCAGGIIIPSLSLGAILGDVVASNITAVPSAFIILLYTASLLSATIGAPLTGAVLIILLVKPPIIMCLYVLSVTYLSHYLGLFIKRLSWDIC